MSEEISYDALLVLSFGGPEGPADVMPFLDRVLDGKNVPEERKKEVAHHYDAFGGISPINAQNRALIAALEHELRSHKISLPIYWGNRNWHPLLADTMKQMKDDGVHRALAFFTSAYSSYSGCRQYREDVARAREEVGEGAPVVEKLRVFFNHPGFVDANVDRLNEAFASLASQHRDDVQVLFTAHSLPVAMAQRCDYEKQLRATAELVAVAGKVSRWELVYQSRSGPPHQPWLAPDVCDRIEELHREGAREIVIAPIGFISDHMEVVYDLDDEARTLCDRLGVRMVRAATAGIHPRFVSMIRELIEERVSPSAGRLAIGQLPPWHDVCPETCCLRQ